MPVEAQAGGGGEPPHVQRSRTVSFVGVPPATPSPTTKQAAAAAVAAGGGESNPFSRFFDEQQGQAAAEEQMAAGPLQAVADAWESGSHAAAWQQQEREQQHRQGQWGAAPHHGQALHSEPAGPAPSVLEQHHQEAGLAESTDVTLARGWGTQPTAARPQEGSSQHQGSGGGRGWDGSRYGPTSAAAAVGALRPSSQGLQEAAEAAAAAQVASLRAQVSSLEAQLAAAQRAAAAAAAAQAATLAGSPDVAAAVEAAVAQEHAAQEVGEAKGAA